MRGIGRNFLPSAGALAGQGAFVAIVLVFVLVAFLGGASRSDVMSLMILRPAAILLLGYGLLNLRWDQVKDYPYLFGIASAAVLLTLSQLIPLPPDIWSSLPGREAIVGIDRAAGLGAVWRPISLTPDQTWNSFFAMLVPLAVLVLGCQLNGEQRGRLIPLLVAIGFISALLGVLQILGPTEGPAYLYRRTDFGAPVGLFANRNHQATLLACMFPVLAVFASFARTPQEHGFRRAAALGLATAIMPLLFIVGSRSGLLVGLLGAASALFLYRPERQSSGDRRRSDDKREKRAKSRRGPQWRSIALIAGVVVLGLALSMAAILMDRGEAFQRVFEQREEGELRFRAWAVIWQLVVQYLPFGSGMGSFVEVFQIAEPRDLLDSTYLNHAHNDWLELLLTGGIPAFILLVAAVGLTCARAYQLVMKRQRELSQRVLFARLGLALIVQFGIASFGDYPLRTPLLASFFMLAALWAAAPSGPPRRSH